MLRETPRNAIYRHGGQTYRVQDIIRGKHLVRVRRELTRNESFPYIHKDIAIRTVLKTAEYSVVRLATVRIEVSEYLQSLTERDRSGNMIQTWPGSGGMPTHKLPTEGTMLALKPVLEATLRKQLRCRQQVLYQHATH